MRHEFDKTLPFPVPFPDEPPYLVICNVTRVLAHHELGAPHKIDWVDGLGMTDFWAFEYECGLQVVYDFCHSSTFGIILADSPEVAHVIRHCPFDRGDCDVISPDELEIRLERLIRAFPSRAAEFSNLYKFQVWRQDDNGNVFAVSNPTSERDARCWIRQFECLGHKQTYWYSTALNQ
jgi:hypothetical protein